MDKQNNSKKKEEHAESISESVRGSQMNTPESNAACLQPIYRSQDHKQLMSGPSLQQNTQTISYAQWKYKRKCPSISGRNRTKNTSGATKRFNAFHRPCTIVRDLRAT
ncbi:hypothetical protein DPMN_025704 [Dreissena polymorpha]|uniref:Uncharacterized protein n=1 Tax=Dreissena polymorpha TaxID=45954 RepID=A0A9D4LRJ6_DREPO|nr:hypothetical protein DPMN_025704 [Dreissena polymorpha]